MKYLFFDLEYASQKGGTSKICEFGYVITDESFKIFERNNFIIDPNISREDYDWRVVRNILTRKLSEYESSPIFTEYYENISQLIKYSDYIIGHSLNCDAKALNDECLRYDRPSIDFEFYDVKEIYKDYKNTRKDVSVVNILNELNILGENNTHDAETDAYNTMIELKTMIETLNITFDELLQLCSSRVKDTNNDYKVASIEANRIKREQEFKKYLSGDTTNDITKYSKNRKRFLQFLDNVKPSKKGNNIFKDKKVSISINYEEHHYRQMLNLVQIIVNEGGTLILKGSLSDLFVKYDIYQEDGTLRRDSKLDYVNKANDNGANIEIIEFCDLLDKLNMTEEELDNMSLVSFDFLFDDNAIIKNIKDKKIINKQKQGKNFNKSANTNLGELYGDYFDKLSDELKDEDEENDDK